jgi:hypothetical protein
MAGISKLSANLMEIKREMRTPGINFFMNINSEATLQAEGMTGPARLRALQNPKFAGEIAWLSQIAS